MNRPPLAALLIVAAIPFAAVYDVNHPSHDSKTPLLMASVVDTTVLRDAVAASPVTKAAKPIKAKPKHPSRPKTSR